MDTPRPEPWYVTIDSMKARLMYCRFIAIAEILLTIMSLQTHGVELLVKWRHGPESPAAQLANIQMGGSVIRNFPAIGWQLVRIARDIEASEAIKAYSLFTDALVVELNSRIQTVLPQRAVGESVRNLTTAGNWHANSVSSGLIPNDPRFREQWYLGRISATNAWTHSNGSSNVVVAVIDSGINYRHEDLALNMWRNPGETGLDANGNDKATNHIDDDGNGYVDDLYGIDVTGDGLVGDSDPFDEGVDAGPGVRIYHGTACAGVIGAVGNNAKGIAGLNWSVQLMAIRTGGPNNVAYASQFVEAFNYIVAMKKRGINVRVTSNSYFTDPLGAYSQALKDSIDLAGTEGILNIAAASNFSSDLDRYPSYPAAYDCPSIISVASSDANDQLRPSSSYGRTGVDLAAPGAGITTTFDANNYYSEFSGTSAAAPIVAGAAALLLAAKPSATVNELKAALLGSADQPIALKGKVATNGRLNVARAMEFIATTTNPPVVVTALPGGQRTDPSAPIHVIFNRAMNHATVESAFVITPPVSGRFDWADDDRSFFFRHDIPFDTTTNYVARVLGTARDDAGETLDGNFNRSQDGSPADDFLWTFGLPVANDDFRNAQLLTGPSGSVIGSNRYASVEPNEPFHVLGEFGTSWNSLWYRWTAPEIGGWFTFDLTTGTFFDTILAVYTGEQLEQLEALAGNDNYGTKSGSRVTFEALAGETYTLAVSSKAPNDTTRAGNFTLVWYPTAAPGFTGLEFFPKNGPPGTIVTLTGTNFTGAAAISILETICLRVTPTGGCGGFGQLSHDLVFMTAATNNLDLRITATVSPDAGSGPITIVTPHGSVTSSSIFEVLPPTLGLVRSSRTELNLSWTGTKFTLEASTDLRSWSPSAPAGATNAKVNATENQRFFRLSRR
jgi:thermitase